MQHDCSQTNQLCSSCIIFKTKTAVLNEKNMTVSSASQDKAALRPSVAALQHTESDVYLFFLNKCFSLSGCWQGSSINPTLAGLVGGA